MTGFVLQYALDAFHRDTSLGAVWENGYLLRAVSAPALPPRIFRVSLQIWVVVPVL